MTGPGRVAGWFDPRGAIGESPARARLRAALGAEARTASLGPLHVGAAGAGELVSGPGALAVADGPTAMPPPSAGAAQAWLRARRDPFAVAAWDEGAGRGLIARDQLGLRPLFYCEHAGAIAFASEIAVLVDLLPRRPAPDLAALAAWIAGTGAAGPELHRGLERLPCAHALWLDRGGWRRTCWWRPEPAPALVGDREQAQERVRAGVLGAVRRRIEPGTAVAVLASGGLDSSAVLWAVAQATPGAVPPAYGGVFPAHPQIDERPWMEALGSAVGSPVQPVALTARPVLAAASEFAARFQLPLPHPNHVFFAPVLAAARAAGAHALFDGEGGDELFGCEPMLLADLLVRAPWRVPALARRLPGTRGELRPRTAAVIAREWLLPALAPRLHGAVAARRRAAHRPGWLRTAPAPPGPASPWWRRPGPRWHRHLAWLLTDARDELGATDHLRRVAELAGIRAVHPLLDVELVELVLATAPELSFDPVHDRPLLRGALRGRLPDRLRLRESKPAFNDLMVEQLSGPEAAAAAAWLGGGGSALGAIADVAALRRMVQAGPRAHPGGPRRWAHEVWRAVAAQSWLEGRV